jgi:hypothetical protein
MRAIILLAMIVAFSGCSVFDTEDPDYDYHYAAVESVEVLSIEEGRVSILCCAAVPTPCHTYGGKSVRREGSEVLVRLSSRILHHQACIMMLSSLKQKIVLEVARGQRYTFRFESWGGATIDVEVEVP